MAARAALTGAVAAAALGAVAGCGGEADPPARAAAAPARVTAKAPAPQAPRAATPAAEDDGGGYGKIPDWLPQAKVPVGRIVGASPAHPALAIQGDTLAVHLPGTRLHATVVGPAVPGRRAGDPVPETSPCTFTVTLRVRTGALALRASAFAVRDELGHLHAPRVSAADGSAAPATAVAGRTVVLHVATVLPGGGGRLLWSPTGHGPVATWDFEVELD